MYVLHAGLLRRGRQRANSNESRRPMGRHGEENERNS